MTPTDPSSAAAASPASALLGTGKAHRFSLHYAPHPGLFSSHAGNDYLDQIRFAADLGFTAWEDRGLMGRAPELQERAGGLLAERGLKCGPFLGYFSYRNSYFVQAKEGSRRALRERMVRVAECAERTGAKWTAVVPGLSDPKQGREKQSAQMVRNLKMCAEILAPSGVTMVLHADRRSPRAVLRSGRDAFDLCRAVGSPRCKVLADTTQGVSAIEEIYDEVACVNLSQDPCAHPKSSAILDYLTKKGFQGVLGMEHAHLSRGRTGEAQLVQAYRDTDNLLF